jgi:tetratricopeptide (TPR) repeat protein
MKAFRCIFYVLFIPLLISGALTFAGTVDEGEQLLGQGLKRFDQETLLRAKAIFEEQLKSKERDPRLLYLLARSINGLAYVEELQENQNAALELILQAVKQAETAADLAPNVSEHHRLLATLYGRLIYLKGGAAAITYGPMNEQQFQEALGLDPNNARAHLEYGIARANTPPQFGGDLAEGISEMKKAISLDPGLDMAYYYLGKVLSTKKQDEKRAREIWTRGLEVNPHNGFIKKALEE